jgi:hypothetical protein
MKPRMNFLHVMQIPNLKRILNSPTAKPILKSVHCSIAPQTPTTGDTVALRAIWRRSFGVIWRTKVNFENSRGGFANDSIISFAWLFVLSD